MSNSSTFRLKIYKIVNYTPQLRISDSIPVYEAGLMGWIGNPKAE